MSYPVDIELLGQQLITDRLDRFTREWLSVVHKPEVITRISLVDVEIYPLHRRLGALAQSTQR
ncbi:hypothetical protein [Nocardia cyriacigeorgica]|uniref:hypothetical protein n=1 Tax=Nocardia cyriacigeorgica TaxID=135487 RepID=UPI001E3D93CF|nr:hypothetical protein [Nocardia cyriacigeorgica]